MLSVAENPPMVPDSVGSLFDLPGQWWVAHTKARSEKALAWDLIAQDIVYFLPMLRQVAIWGGRKRTVMKPLFASYLFFCSNDQDRIKAQSSGRICQVIPVRQRSEFVTELETLRRTLADNRPMVAYPFAAVGKRCRVKYGPLEGIEGIVIRNQDTTQIVLQVSMLGQGASLEIEPELLEPAD